MNNLKMIAELESNCKKNMEQLCELFKAYDLAKLGYDMQEEQTKECYNTVLAANPFYAPEDYDRAGIKAGDRITSEKNMYFLRDEDFDHLLAMTTAELAKEGITDAEGTYLTDWLGIKGDARRALVDFIINNILPEAFKAQFEEARLNITYQHKLIGITRPIVQKAA